MDYDSTDIPSVYDRARNHGPEVLELWMNVVASRAGEQRVNTILDLGCGTGRFSDFQAGLEAMRAHAERVRDTPVSEPIDVFVFN